MASARSALAMRRNFGLAGGGSGAAESFMTPIYRASYRAQTADAVLRPAICVERPRPASIQLSWQPSSARRFRGCCRGFRRFFHFDRLQREVSGPFGKTQRAAEAILAWPFRLALGEAFGEHPEQLFDPVVIAGEDQPLFVKIFRGHVHPLPR